MGIEMSFGEDNFSFRNNKADKDKNIDMLEDNILAELGEEYKTPSNQYEDEIFLAPRRYTKSSNIEAETEQNQKSNVSKEIN